VRIGWIPSEENVADVASRRFCVLRFLFPAFSSSYFGSDASPSTALEARAVHSRPPLFFSLLSHPSHRFVAFVRETTQMDAVTKRIQIIQVLNEKYFFYLTPFLICFRHKDRYAESLTKTRINHSTLARGHSSTSPLLGRGDHPP
jgi:hypothetical protein